MACRLAPLQAPAAPAQAPVRQTGKSWLSSHSFCAASGSRGSALLPLSILAASTRGVRRCRQHRARVLRLGYEQEVEVARRERDLKLRDAVQEATQVPESFEEAVSVACAAVLAAISAGELRQSLYYSLGDPDEEDEEDGLLSFVGELVTTLARSGYVAGGIIRIFCRADDVEICKELWAPMPGNLELRASAEPSGAALLLAVAPAAEEMGKLLAMSEGGLPVIVVNANWSSTSESVDTFPGSLIFGPYYEVLKRKQLAEASVATEGHQSTTTFHLEQLEPSEGELTLNSSVVARAWPKPFSVWEEDAEDGSFTLLDLSRGPHAPPPRAVRTMLAAARDEREERRRARVAAEHARRYKDANKAPSGM